MKRAGNLIILWILATSTLAQGGHQILKDFTGRQEGDQVILQWTMLEGETCFGIRIERSGDRKSFDKIGAISGVCGSPSEAIVFTFTDTIPLKNRDNYYRLELGSQGFSEPINVKTVITGKQGYHIAPHPAINTLNIAFENVEPKELRIYSPSGTMLTSVNGDGRQMSFSLAEYRSGLYIFRAVTDSGTTINGTFVVVK